MKIRIFIFIIIFSCIVCAVKQYTFAQNMQEGISSVVPVNIEDEFFNKLVQGAIERTKRTHFYDPAYKRIKYPNGDIPDDRGVCTDVIVRSYRMAGIDLQKEIHEDMKNNFNKYPQKWGLRGPDQNIDHRRVPNLMKYFERQNANKNITQNVNDYSPGDVVAWKLDNGLLHIGLVINEKNSDRSSFLIVHNIGNGTQKEDVLFNWEIIGHYRYKN
ncbi:DUF1287 domain-containing protein [Thermodesulfobacteriota bacterium]